MLKERSEIDKKYKWNLDDIYKNWIDWEKDLKLLEEMMKILPSYQGKIKEEKTFLEFREKSEKMTRLLDKLYLYPYLLKDLDSTDEETTIKMQQIESVYMNFAVSMSWVEPEMLEIPEATINEWMTKNKKLNEARFPISELYRLKSHVLSHEKEELLSYYGQYMSIPSDIYAELSISDIKWNEITLSNGEKALVTNGMYSKIVSTNRNQEDRRLAFEALYNSFNNSKNTFAAIYRSIIYRNVASSRARKFPSSLEKALENKNVPKQVFENLLEITKKNTKPLRRYVELRKKYLNLKEYHYYDNSKNIVDYDKLFPYDDAKKIVLNSVKILGEDYYNKMEKAMSEGWLDVFETKNKRSGAYSINIYDVHPYMLLNYQETLDDVFTLAHELGHTMHSILSSENQPYVTADYTIFVAEVASTFNERLLLDYMLKNTQDSKEKIALLEQALSNFVGTYYIQTLFANYEYLAHSLVEKGEAITADVLSNIMKNLFKEYFDDTLVFDDLQKIIWSRIPHFFNSPFYVYQYATSFAASSKLYAEVKKSSESLDKYLNMLKSGGNNHPMEQLKLAGADLSKAESFEIIAEEFDKLLDIFEKELKKN